MDVAEALDRLPKVESHDLLVLRLHVPADRRAASPLDQQVQRVDMVCRSIRLNS